MKENSFANNSHDINRHKFTIYYHFHYYQARDHSLRLELRRFLHRWHSIYFLYRHCWNISCLIAGIVVFVGYDAVKSIFCFVFQIRRVWNPDMSNSSSLLQNNLCVFLRNRQNLYCSDVKTKCTALSIDLFKLNQILYTVTLINIWTSCYSKYCCGLRLPTISLDIYIELNFILIF